MVLTAIGAATVFAGQGTFASFSAETSNNGSSVSSGTLTMSDSVNSAAACVTTSAATANNLNAGCGAAITMTNVAPGLYGGSAQITLQNSGSIDASKLYLYASSVNATLFTPLVSNATVTSLTLSSPAGIEGNISIGDNIVVSNDTHSETFVASAPASGGATTISVTSLAANYAYPAGSTVTDTSSNTSTGPTLVTTALTSGAAVTNLTMSSVPGPIANGESLVITSGVHTQTFVANGATTASATSKLVPVTSQNANFSYPVGSTLTDGSSNALNANIDCYDRQTTASGSPGSTFGTNLNFNPIWGNPLCGSMLIYVQELSTVNPSSALVSGTPITSLPVTPLGSAVTTGDPIVITSGVHTQTFAASSGAAIGATAIPITSATPTFAYPTTSQVLDPNSGNYCWVGKTSTLTGACDAPVSVNLSAALATTPNTTSLPVAPLNGNVLSGDAITVTSGTTIQTFIASANAYVGATSIPVGSQAATIAFPTTSVVTDAAGNTTLSDMNADTTHTITNFDTSHGVGGKVELIPVTANNVHTASTIELGRSDSRTFEIGVYFPAPTGTNQNQLQGLASTFGITWHMDQ